MPHSFSAMDGDRREFIESTRCSWIAKPLEFDDVRRAVHRLLTATA